LKRRILWIEDSAFHENVAFTGPVAMSGRYDMTTVVTATAGLNAICHGDYDVTIVDIRIGPGNDPRWVDEYRNNGENTKAARLGLRLLEIVLGERAHTWRDDVVPERARDALKYGVLTVEPQESLPTLDDLGIRAYRNKQAAVHKRLLLELIDEVIANSAGR
jgi:hypothetical protein